MQASSRSPPFALSVCGLVEWESDSNMPAPCAHGWARATATCTITDAVSSRNAAGPVAISPTAFRHPAEWGRLRNGCRRGGWQFVAVAVEEAAEANVGEKRRDARSVTARRLYPLPLERLAPHDDATLSFVLPALRLGDAILDVGCGHGYVPETLVAAGSSDLTAVDVLDARRVPLPISSCSMACTCRSTTDASTS